MVLPMYNFGSMMTFNSWSTLGVCGGLERTDF